MLATCYIVLQRVLQLISLLCRSSEFKELEIVVFAQRERIVAVAILRPDSTVRPAHSQIDPRLSATRACRRRSPCSVRCDWGEPDRPA
jgi:hypothetical protein